MHWLLRLYPRLWRERYEEEMLALLEDHKITAATIIDLVIGAVDANLNYEGTTKGGTFMVNRLRSSIVMIFCSFMLFGIGWILLQRNPMNQFLAHAQFHPGFIVLNKSIFLIGCLGFLAFFIGGLPIFLFSVKRAIKNKQKDVLVPLSIATACLFLFTLATVILSNWHNITFFRAHFITMIICYLSIFLVLLLIGTFSTSLFLSRTEFQLSELKYAFIPEMIIFFCIVLSVIIATTYIVVLIFNAEQLSNTQYIGSFIYITGIFLMALSSIFTAMGLKRGMIKNIDHFSI